MHYLPDFFHLALFPRFIHVIAPVGNSFYCQTFDFMQIAYFFLHQVDGYPLVSYYDSTAMSISYIDICMYMFSVILDDYLSGIAVSCDSSMFNCLRN